MLRLTTLGIIDLRDRLGRPVRDVLAQPKRIALLIHLVVEGRRGPVALERVLAMFWPESDEPRARNALSQALYHLRQAIGTELLLRQGATIELAPGAIWCDALVLEEALEAGDAELALDLHRGEFCAGLAVAGSSAVEDWLSEIRREHKRRLLDLTWRGVQRAATAGDADGAARLARRAMVLGPEDERHVREYLSAVDAAGDRTGALALYAEYARRLAVELEVEPSSETAALVDRIKRRRSDPMVEASVEASVEVSVESPSPPPPLSTRPPALTTPPPRLAAHSPWRALGLAGVATVVLALGLASRTRLGSAADRRDDPGAPSAIAVFPFTVRGGESAEMLTDGLALLLAAKLDGTEDVRAIDPRSATNAAGGHTPEPRAADALSRQLGARYFVLGDLVERAGRLEMNGALFATGRPGRAVASATVAGDTTELFALVDDLAGRLLSTILPGRDSSLTKLAAVTTSSLPALKAYLRGERAMREGQDARAAAAFRDAVSLDTNFALAQYRLALVANWITVPGTDDPIVWARAAARNDERLTPLGRDLVEAFLAYKAPSSTAGTRYQAILQAYPDNVEAWFMYAEALFHYGPIGGHPADEARAAFERVLELDPANSHALVHLARLAALGGRLAELESIAARLEAQHAGAERSLETRALLAWARHDSAATARAFAEARRADGIVVYGLAQSAALYSGELGIARDLARLLVTPGTLALLQPYGRSMLAEATIASGRWPLDGPDAPSDPADRQSALESEVLLAVEPLLATPRERLLYLRARVIATRPFRAISIPSRPLTGVVAANAAATMRLHLLGLLDVQLGDLTAAKARVDSIEARAGSADSSAIRPFAISLRAEVLRSEGRYAEALAELERFSYEFNGERLFHLGVRERFARAELLTALHRDREALPWYASYPAFYDLGLVAPARLREAQLLERLGRPLEARARYERFLGLWQDPDPSFLPLVAQARAALTRLR